MKWLVTILAIAFGLNLTMLLLFLRWVAKTSDPVRDDEVSVAP